MDSVMRLRLLREQYEDGLRHYVMARKAEREGNKVLMRVCLLKARARYTQCKAKADVAECNRLLGQ